MRDGIRRVVREVGRWATGTVVVVTLAAVTAIGSAAQEVSLPLGTAAPSAAVEDLDGNAVDLLDYIQGRPTLIEFWATWCENCEILQRQVDEIREEHGDDLGVVAVAVAVSQSLRRVKRHLEDHDPGYPYLWDADGAAVRAYRAPAASTVVILDAEGVVVYTGTGAQQDLITAVERVLGGN